MNSRPKDPKTARNKNVLVIGGSGSGKTRFWLKPNLMQMHSSYVVTDPKGTILVECGKMLQRGTPKLGKDGKPMKDKHGKVIYEPYRIITVLQTLVIALGAGLGIWGVINLLEGYGNDNPGANAHVR